MTTAPRDAAVPMRLRISSNARCAAQGVGSGRRPLPQDPGGGGVRGTPPDPDVLRRLLGRAQEAGVMRLQVADPAPLTICVVSADIVVTLNSRGVGAAGRARHTSRGGVTGTPLTPRPPWTGLLPRLRARSEPPRPRPWPAATISAPRPPGTLP